MTNIPPPREGLIETLEPVPHRPDRWRDQEGTRIYEWDRLHGEFEVYNRRGRHLGAVDVEGRFKKEPVKGRRIDV